MPVPHPARGLAALRRLAAARPAREHCELCAAEIRGEHEHLVDPQARRLLCACAACAILFDHAAAGRYRRVPRDVRELTRLDIGDALWNSFAIPIGLVFFFRSSVAGAVLAVYPSPGGPAEVSVDPDTWNDFAALHSAIAGLAADVEAVLVHRLGPARDYYIVPIDECYRLTGIVRSHWSGFTGGDELWEHIRAFFAELKRRAQPAVRARHA